MQSAQQLEAARLHPVYVALENQHYSRAVKLCQAPQHASSKLAKALLAHAYIKMDQRYLALLTMQQLLLADVPLPASENESLYFAELDLEIRQMMEYRQEAAKAAEATATASSTPSSAAKKNKKGKRKGATTPVATAVPIAAAIDTEKSISEDRGVFYFLDNPPSLPEDWEKLPPAQFAPVDETLLSTITMAMTSHLRLPLTAYQVYCWAVSRNNTDIFLVHKAYLSGLAVLIIPQYRKYTSDILANLQTLAMQMARMQPQGTAWAAQNALWQVQFQDGNETDEKLRQRLGMMPRLAESLAHKVVHTLPSSNDNLVESENFLLYIRTLDVQQKYQEQIDAIVERLEVGREQMAPPKQTLLDLQSQAWIKLKDYAKAKSIIEGLLRESPDDWRYWKRHMDCCIGLSDGSTGDTREFVHTISKQTLSSQYPIRGPHLMLVELAKQEGDADKLKHEIQEYVSKFADKTTTVFSDVAPYLEHWLTEKGPTAPDIEQFLAWVQTKSTKPVAEDPREQRAQLRSYILSIQLIYKVVSHFPDLSARMPGWVDLLQVWTDFEGGTNEVQAQKEARPADTLVLLAVQQVLYLHQQDGDRNKLFLALVVLELAIRRSPYNAYIKIAAISVYGELHSVSRAWELWNELQIKHIQHESCSFLILPLLQSGGLYRELIKFGSDVLKVQTSALRDATDFVGRAMEQGTSTKAEEFIEFHRECMNKSLTLLEAKGLVLDVAPMYVQHERQEALGALHGIVGGSEDFQRAIQMVEEVHNPTAALNALTLQGNAEEVAKGYVDHRDFAIFSHDILIKRTFPSVEEIVRNSLRRGHYHNLLVRAALCLEATKGLKKGKLAKRTLEQDSRCQSLLKTVKEGSSLSGSDIQAVTLRTLHLLCRVVVAFSAGLFIDSDIEDTVETREQQTTIYLKETAGSLQKLLLDLNLQDLQDVGRACRLVPCCIIPTVALFRMCVSGSELFGWGPRKHKSKPCAAAVVQVAVELKTLIDSISAFVERIPDNDFTSGFDDSQIMNLVPSDVSGSTRAMIRKGYEVTRSRVSHVLNDMGALVEESIITE